ncbi:hypothetical protein Tco_1370702 [Tanacetum coccineum]
MNNLYLCNLRLGVEPNIGARVVQLLKYAHTEIACLILGSIDTPELIDSLKFTIRKMVQELNHMFGETTGCGESLTNSNLSIAFANRGG